MNGSHISITLTLLVDTNINSKSRPDGQDDLKEEFIIKKEKRKKPYNNGEIGRYIHDLKILRFDLKNEEK